MLYIYNCKDEFKPQNNWCLKSQKNKKTSQGIYNFYFTSIFTK